MRLSTKDSKYVLLQRTEFFTLSSTPFIRKLPLPLLAAIESPFKRRTLEREFERELEQEYNTLASFLPGSAREILDIGCGIGAIDLFLYKHYKDTNIHLFDKSAVSSSVFYGYEKEGAFYNSLASAKSFLVQNGVPSERIHTHEVSAGYPLGTFDLIISLISWGFHYPLSTYLEEVRNSLMPGGTLILDVRKGTEGEEMLRGAFADVQMIGETARSKRLKCSNSILSA